MPSGRRLRVARAEPASAATLCGTLYPRICAFAAFALALGACATSGDDTDTSGDDTGTIPEADAAADVAPGSDATYGGYDSAAPDASAQPDASPGVDAFPPPTDAATHLDSSTGVDSSAPDSSSPDTGPAGPCSFTGAIATFALTNETGDETSVAATSSATGVTVGALTRASGLTATSGTGSINSSGWPITAAADASKYYTFTVTAPTGCTLSLTSMALDVKASGTGPATGDVATSADNFGTHTTSFAGTSNTNVTFSSVSGTSAIEVRVYGYGGTSTAGTFRIMSTLTLSGSTS